MSDIGDSSGPDLAARIKAERGSRNWSLAELAQRSGVSKSMLSAIERGETSPTAALLVRVAAAFGLTLSALIARAEMAGRRLLRAGDQPEWRDPATGCVRRHVSPASDSPLELIRVEMPAGKTVSLPAASYTFIRQLIWLIEGGSTSRRERCSTTCAPATASNWGPRPTAPFTRRDRVPRSISSRS